MDFYLSQRHREHRETEDMVNNMSMVINGETFTTFEDLWESSNLTQAEKDEIVFETKLMGKLIEAREQKGISQKQLAEISGLNSPL